MVPCPHGAVGRECCWPCGKTGPDYCGDMNAAIDALKALRLGYSVDALAGVPHVTVTDRVYRMADLSEGAAPMRAKMVTIEDATPAALATALVQATVQVLESDGTP